MSEWSEWSECNKSCGKGHTIRTRMIKLEPQFGGSPCLETIQRKKCKIRKCRTKGGGGERRRKKAWLFYQFAKTSKSCCVFQEQEAAACSRGAAGLTAANPADWACRSASGPPRKGQRATVRTGGRVASATTIPARGHCWATLRRGTLEIRFPAFYDQNNEGDFFFL